MRPLLAWPKSMTSSQPAPEGVSNRTQLAIVIAPPVVMLAMLPWHRQTDRVHHFRLRPSGLSHGARERNWTVPPASSRRDCLLRVSYSSPVHSRRYIGTLYKSVGASFTFVTVDSDRLIIKKCPSGDRTMTSYTLFAPASVGVSKLRAVTKASAPVLLLIVNNAWSAPPTML